CIDVQFLHYYITSIINHVLSNTKLGIPRYATQEQNISVKGRDQGEFLKYMRKGHGHWLLIIRLANLYTRRYVSKIRGLQLLSIYHTSNSTMHLMHGAFAYLPVKRYPDHPHDRNGLSLTVHDSCRVLYFDSQDSNELLLSSRLAWHNPLIG